MSTDLIYALFWFSIGAFLHHVLSLLINRKERRHYYYSLTVQLLTLSSIFRGQMEEALDQRKRILSESDMTEEEIEKECSAENQMIQNWELVYTATVLGSMPEDIVKTFKTELERKK